MKDKITKNQLRLLDKIESVRETDVYERSALAVYNPVFILCTLPHKDPGEVELYRRSSGQVHLGIQPGYNLQTGKSFGIPYGTIPRLLLAFICTETVRTSSKKLRLGKSLNEFMTRLELVPSGGRWGSIRRLKTQMNRLFNARIMIQDFRKSKGDGPKTSKNIQLVDEIEEEDWSDNIYWMWSKKTAGQDVIFDNTITLSDKFYNHIIENPVPFDMDVLQAVKSSPLAIDLYLWSTYRVFNLKGKTSIPFVELHKQFGSHYSNIKNFTQRVKKHLLKIAQLYPDLRYETERANLVLYPSKTSVPRIKK